MIFNILIRLRGPLRPSVVKVDLRPTKTADEKVWFNWLRRARKLGSPELAPEFRVQGLPWDSYQLIELKSIARIHIGQTGRVTRIMAEDRINFREVLHFLTINRLPDRSTRKHQSLSTSVVASFSWMIAGPSRICSGFRVSR
jgi:hypothetical protein